MVFKHVEKVRCQISFHDTLEDVQHMWVGVIMWPVRRYRRGCLSA